MAASNSCFFVSSTVNYVHGSLPFLTALSEEATRGNLSTAAVLSSSPGYLGSLFDLYIRSLSWGFLIVLLFLVLILTTALYLASVYFCCFKKTSDPDRRTQLGDTNHPCAIWCCGAFTIAFAVCAVAMLSLSFWLESTLNRLLLSHAPPYSIMTENIRHWIVLFVLIVAALFLAFAIVAFVLLIFCKWTKFFTIILSSLLVIVALIAPVAGVGLSLLSFTSAFCEEFSELSDCSLPITQSWSDICTSAFQDGFILVMLSCGFALCVTLGQCSGSVFSQLFLRRLKIAGVDRSIIDAPTGLHFSNRSHDAEMSVRSHPPTAPPPTDTFVGESHFDHARHLHTSRNAPTRRQTMPAVTSTPSEPPPVYDDAWLSQSVHVPRTQPAPPSSRTDTNADPNIDQNHLEHNTAL